LKKLTADDLRPLWSRLDIPISKIAAPLGVTQSALGQKARALGLPSRHGNREMSKRVDDKTFARLWMAGLAMKDIAKVCGYQSINGVSCRRRRQGLPPRKRATTVVDGVMWEGTITLAQFYEQEVARMMAGGAK
jgi:hypothetical protein